MKRLTVFFLILSITSGWSQAPGRFEMGLYSGVEYNFVSSTTKDVVNAYQSLPAFNIGFRLQHHFSTRYSIAGGMELSYLQFIYSQPDPQMGTSPIILEQGLLEYDMFRMPLLFQMNFGEGKSKFFFNAGPTIMICDVKNSRMYTTTFGSSPEVINYLNLGVNAAAGYSYNPAHWLKFYIETSFIAPVFSTPHNAFYGPASLRVLAIGGRFGVSFRLHRPKFMDVRQ